MMQPAALTIEHGRSRLAYTRRAFQALPELDKPRILDIGCGTGMPTLELARLSDGEIVAIDIDRGALDELSQNVRDAGLSDRILVLYRSMLELDFPEEHFDVIWCEGAVFVIGFSAALRDWRKFIKPAGYLVIHEAIWRRSDPPSDVADYWRRKHGVLHTSSHYIEEIRRFGYELIDTFSVPAQVWWDDYYGPLEERIRELEAGTLDPDLRAAIADQRRDIEMYRKSYSWFGSAIFVMRKKQAAAAEPTSEVTERTRRAD